MRVRGDGRSYVLNISTTGYYDITWNDVYHYVLYTRGGPYWQFVKVTIHDKLTFQIFMRLIGCFILIRSGFQAYLAYGLFCFMSMTVIVDPYHTTG